MSNKTRLQTNNDNLQSILDTVDSLPSGNGATAKFKTGTISARGTTFSSGVTIASYSGLSFVPKYVMIWPNSTKTSFTYKAGTPYWFASAQGGLVAQSTSTQVPTSTTGGGYIYSSTSTGNVFEITLNDNGFTVTAKGNVCFASTALKFLAIGDCEFEEV